MSVTYSNYLQLDGLLDLQQPLSDGPEHDETLFIIIHQVYELWFKQVLHELDHLAKLFEENAVAGGRDRSPRILHTLHRILTLFKTMVAQVDILETMTPMSFNSFRQRLDTASGFQSPQFRELEFFLGLRDPRMLRFHEENPQAYQRLQQRLEEPSIYQSFLRYIGSCGYTIPADALVPSKGPAPLEDEGIRNELIRMYREDDRLTQICERLVDLDEGLQEWRYRHVKMVERTIGTKRGTGGSGGAEYLKKTLFQSVFPDLWTIRADL